MGLLIRSFFRAIQRGQRQRDKVRRALDTMAKRELQIIEHSYQLALSTKTLQTMRTRFDAINQAIERLKNLETQHNVRTSPSADDFRAQFDGRRDESLYSFYKRSIGNNIDKALVVASKTTAYRLLDKSRMLIIEAKTDIKEEGRIRDLVTLLNEREKEIDWSKYESRRDAIK